MSAETIIFLLCIVPSAAIFVWFGRKSDKPVKPPTVPEKLAAWYIVGSGGVLTVLGLLHHADAIASAASKTDAVVTKARAKVDRVSARIEHLLDHEDCCCEHPRHRSTTSTDVEDAADILTP
jgi:hypothetical protein